MFTLPRTGQLVVACPREKKIHLNRSRDTHTHTTHTAPVLCDWESFALKSTRLLISADKIKLVLMYFFEGTFTSGIWFIWPEPKVIKKLYIAAIFLSCFGSFSHQAVCSGSDRLMGWWNDQNAATQICVSGNVFPKLLLYLVRNIIKKKFWRNSPQ